LKPFYEHGAGHARKDYETERDEQAEDFAQSTVQILSVRIRKDRSNAEPTFVGVFDTVAALGASGWRRFFIQAGLTLLFAGVASFASAVVATVPSLIAKHYFDLGFWWSELAIGAALIVLSVLCFLYSSARNTRRRSRFSNKATNAPIRPNGSQATSTASCRSMWHGSFGERIDERRKDFDRVTWGQKDSTQCRKRGLRATLRHRRSYPETESRLSDISLQWMLEEILALGHSIDSAGNGER